MVKSEYLRFLQTLNTDNFPNDVRKIANLVLQHMEVLIPLSTSQGQRIKKIVELAQMNWNTISSDIQPIKEEMVKQECPLNRIKSLTVGPFRGFSKQEVFDLSSKLVLIYGPNGTGKSSFCEALEYGLLNNVTEAESKRFRNQHDYLINAYTNSFNQPIVIGADDQENEYPIAANEALYRFCFIEKNRIDNFSRIAAQTPAKQTELISTLFGLDAFLEFVRNFTDLMDKYIDLDGVKKEELSQKRKVIDGYLQHIENIPVEIDKIEEDEVSLANEFRFGCDFAQMVCELNGTEENNGLIMQLEAELDKPIGIKSDLTLSELQSLKLSIESDIKMLKTKQQDLITTSQLVAYKQLYEAVIKVKDNSLDQCPVCQTPLSLVTVNPYEQAGVELNKLQYLGELQDAIEILNVSIANTLTRIYQIVNTCCQYSSDNDVLSPLITIGETAVSIDWWNSLHQQVRNELSPWQHVEVQIKKLEDYDKEIEQAKEQRVEKQNELRILRGFAENIVKLQARRDTETKILHNALDEIGKFDTDNSLLIADVEKELSVVAQNKIIANSYSTFVQVLNDYKNSLPALLIKDLGETIVQLYNDFNRYDTEHEQLAKIRLPLLQNHRLEISFKHDPDSFFDALHILSEGHIRCIGLAILMAKNIKEGCPFLIFDDPVNAIDDDHRESIRRTMFEDTYFEGKQIILACHGEEFFKDIQNLLSAKRAKQIKAVSFLPKINDSHIRIDQHCSPRNYVVASRTHYDNNEIRDALDKSRKALESFTKDKVWRYVCKYSDGNLSIKLRSAKAPIELRNLTEQLKKKISGTDFSDQNKNTVLNPIERLLGISGDSMEWRYLNKGTHEEADRAEFDRQTVNEILTALEQLDIALP